MKKILALSPFNFLPPYFGGARRIYNIIKLLSKENKIWIICNNHQYLQKDFNCNEFQQVTNNPNISLKFVKSYGSYSQIINFSEIFQALKIIKKHKPDLIFANNILSGLHAIILQRITGIPYVLDEHDVDYRRREIISGNSLKTKLMRWYENLACQKALKIFCVSELDKDLLISQLRIEKNKIVVAPNSVELDNLESKVEKIIEIKKNLKLNSNPIILFFGQLDYKPNYEAVKIIHDEIVPRVIKKNPNVKFLVVGSNPPLEFKNEKIIFTGVVDKIADFINLSDIVICPLLTGGGTRLKIIEALACRKFVISTSLGAEGISVPKFGGFLEIQDDWDDFSNQIILALSKKDMKVNINFYDYSWEKTVNKINDALENLK